MKWEYLGLFGADKKEDVTIKEKPIATGIIEYIGGHKAHPKPAYSDIDFYEDRIQIAAYNLKIPYSKIKDISNSSEKRRDPSRLVIGVVALPLALAYLWKKNHIYTIIEYDDGFDIQKIVIDFDKNVNYAQNLIYNKMLEYRNNSNKTTKSYEAEKQEKKGSPF